MIDWSDPDEMIGLFAEFVSDEIAESSDRGRTLFLRNLADDLDQVIDDGGSLETIIGALQQIRAAEPREFNDDAVTAHLNDCIEELRRIAKQTAG